MIATRHLFCASTLALALLAACGPDDTSQIKPPSARPAPSDMSSDLGDQGNTDALDMSSDQDGAIDLAQSELPTAEEMGDMASRAEEMGSATEEMGDMAMTPPEPCLADEDCDDPERCLAQRVGQQVTLTCGEPAPGGAELGEACAQDGECLSNLCLDGACSRPCQRPIDCSADGSFVCGPSGALSSSGQPLNVCTPKPAAQCLSDGQCAAGGERCVAERGASEIEFSCGAPNLNGGEAGEPCAQDSECAQNLCLGGVCAPACQANGDCVQGADYTCELRDVTLAQAIDTVQVCSPPISCQSATSCKINQTCYMRRASGALDTLCRAPNLGGGSLGQVCNSDTDCASNLCFESRFGRLCAEACAQASECGVIGYTCRVAEVLDLGGAPISAQICAPSAPPSCTSNDGCSSGTSCAIVPTTSATALEAVCAPATGRLATGVACAQDGDCESRVCLNGSCAAPCTDSTQCGASQLCLNNAITKQGLTQNFQVCERVQDQPCTSSDSCTDGVRVCGDLRQNATSGLITPHCRFPISGGAQLGQACSASSDCREGICLQSVGQCTVVCADDMNCALSANQICTSMSFTGASNHVDLCAPGCTDNASCAPGSVCTINQDLTRDDIDQICEPPIGTGLLGDPCSGGSGCDTGLCLTTYSFTATACSSDAQCSLSAGETCECPVGDPNCVTGKQCATSTQRCSRLCDDHSDCAGGTVGNQLTSCSTDVSVTLPSGTGTKQLSLCGQP